MFFCSSCLVLALGGYPPNRRHFYMCNPTGIAVRPILILLRPGLRALCLKIVGGISPLLGHATLQNCCKTASAIIRAL